MCWVSFIAVIECRMDMPGPTQEPMVLSNPVFMNIKVPVSSLLNWDVFGCLQSKCSHTHTEVQQTPIH